MSLFMNGTEYLVSYGSAGELGRFLAAEPLDCRRGERVVVRTQRGVEIGSVLCPSTPQHAHMLADTFVGELLRPAGPEDEAIAQGVRDRQERLFEDARRLAVELELPLEILDVEVLLDGHQVTLYYLRWAECDERPLVSALSRKYETMVALRDLALPAGASACGKPDCSSGKGGCTSCGTSGCSTCGKTLAKEVKDYFAGLRQKMESSGRVPLA
jgi:cell fate regulator YaaT (PSP1 superfamily)